MLLWVLGKAVQRRSGAGGGPPKTRRRKTALLKRRKASKAVRPRISSDRRKTAPETEITRLRRELTESLEQQKATSEVLSVISSSPGELDPVFKTILENATRICEANFGTLFRFDGDAFSFAAQFGTVTELVEFQRKRGLFHPPAGTPLDRLLRTMDVVRIADATKEPAVGNAARFGGARSLIAVPMLKENVLIGAIIIFRQEIRVFTDKQIDLVTNFAAQAVIAIENTRLLSELRESLAQQTATADVLRIISSSPGELEPVFHAMLENATNLCEAPFGILLLRDEGLLRIVARHTPPDARATIFERGSELVLSDNPNHPLVRMLEAKDVAHIADTRTDPAYIARNRRVVAFVDEIGARTALCVPMLKDNQCVGGFVIFRREVRPFVDKQIELVKNFADQAVIAIENTRLLNELRQRTDDLSKSLDDLRTAQDRLVQTEKLASLGQLTAGIAHEIKNPLNFVNNFSGLSVELIDELAEGLKDVALDDKQRTEFGELTETLRGNLQKVVQHGQRADSIVKNMLLHSREGSGERRSVDINAMVEESLNLAYHGARAEKQGFDITLQRSFDPAAGEADLFPQEITRVLLNLIGNGFYAATKRKQEADNDRYEPTVAASTKNLGDRVEIRIRDNGTGIPPDVKEKMFNPFFTTKPAGEGTGLGLSLSHDIVVKQHSGSIEVATEPGEFTEIRIVLPRAAAVR
jgi:signal transduction histidine kinase